MLVSDAERDHVVARLADEAGARPHAARPAGRPSAAPALDPDRRSPRDGRLAADDARRLRGRAFGAQAPRSAPPCGPSPAPARLTRTYMAGRDDDAARFAGRL